VHIGQTIAEPFLQRGGMAVVIGNLTVGGNQNIVFDNHLSIAGNGNIVPDKGTVLDARPRAIIELPGRNDEATTEPDIVAYIKQCVSANFGESEQLQMFPYRFTAAAEYGDSVKERFRSPPQNWHVPAQFVEESANRLKYPRNRHGGGETIVKHSAGDSKKRGLTAL
jgi:hypothetical protein